MNRAGGTFVNEFNNETWRAASAAGEALLIGYVVGGDPDPERSLDIAEGIVAAGVDILEIGVPSARPKLDGEIIRRGHRRALQSGHAVDGQLPMSYWRRLRERVNAPIWAMGYRKELIDAGLYRELAENGLIDGLVLPDCALDVQRAIAAEPACRHVDVIRFANSGMNDEQLAEATDGATVVYAQTYRGSTGDPMAQLGNLQTLCAGVRRHTGALVVAGFGLRSVKKVREAVESGFDGAVVGTALVARCESGELDYLYRLIADMKLETKRKVGV
ncbi:tryptophan synthase subunit alpha [Paenibacillus flagellatus]|uniref:tryptophan synthase subunit alpha n=1 Tax=Paenibacillus flagellatus TaxID=2211139 RepID=UPI001305115F|nr:tryptophan synthase subunit alpha [Paenibacillus flagellatus]